MKIRLKFHLLFVNSLNLVFLFGSSLKSENAELFLVSLSTGEWFVGINSNYVKTNETWIKPVKLTLHLGADWTALLFKGLWWVSFSCQHHFETSLRSWVMRMAHFALSVGSLQRRHPPVASGGLSEVICSVTLPSRILWAAVWPGSWSNVNFRTCLWIADVWAWPRSGHWKPLMKGWSLHPPPRSPCRQDTGSEPLHKHLLPFAPKHHSWPRATVRCSSIWTWGTHFTCFTHLEVSIKLRGSSLYSTGVLLLQRETEPTGPVHLA